MTILDFVIILIVAGFCGSLGMAIGGYSHGGCVVAMALGFIGALVGVWLARTLVLPEPLMLDAGDVHFPVVWSIIGAALFVAIMRLLTRVASN